MNPSKQALICCLLAGFLITVMAGCAAGEAQEAANLEALSKKSSPLSKAAQEDLAKAIFTKLVGADDGTEPEFYERHYKTVIEKCPDTQRAHESYWRLTNLYKLAHDEPKHEEIVKILEEFLARYTRSSVVSMKKYPDELLVFSPISSLHLAYEELGQYDKIAAYYDMIAAKEEMFAVQEYLDYATALDESGRTKDALVWYQKFLKKSEGMDFRFGRLMAEDRIQKLKQK